MTNEEAEGNGSSSPGQGPSSTGQSPEGNGPPSSAIVASGRTTFLDRLRGLPRPARIATAGYCVAAVFGLGVGIAAVAGASTAVALIVGGVASAPLAIGFIGDRITGFKAFSVEISLAQVTVPVEGDFTKSVMDIAELGASQSPALISTFGSAIQGEARVMRVNLRNDDYWWSTRVYLIAALAEDYTRVDAVVFVKSREERVFVGIAEPRTVRRRNSICGH